MSKQKKPLSVKHKALLSKPASVLGCKNQGKGAATAGEPRPLKLQRRWAVSTEALARAVRAHLLKCRAAKPHLNEIKLNCNKSAV